MYLRPELARGGIHAHSIDTVTGWIESTTGGFGNGTWTSPNNTAVYMPIAVHRAVRAVSLWLGAGATAAGHFDVGLYDESGVALERSGSTVHPGATTEVVYALASPRLLVPGLYYMGFSTDDNTGTYIVQSMAATTWGVRTEASAFPLPATATWTETNAGSKLVAAGVFLNGIAT